jgi:sensor histidine kinase regulating citrate/malate metabolism
MMVGPNIISLFTDNFFKNFISESQSTYPTIQLNYQSKKVQMINVDVNLLKNSIHNIIKNSIEAKASKIMIEVSANSIKFTDNGKGVSQSEAKTIKEKGTIKNDIDHHGIGLYSIAYFCKQNQWELSFYNNKNDAVYPQGFTVEFKF